ncbi:hypothetical protein F5876DRAFT_77942 [Lentinula aff. lateritia]|uniref:Uncharacterized protein n=1 Tax=Lentinula aff. lateritia TaxID=2804960 RepID=A0ACC1TX74_9AGAR|nr:hypothetical protein F5876DRAFT_77942 [Lentinula aff. lateritia]
MAPQDAEIFGSRPRANTTTAFSSFSAPWRKPKVETLATPSTAPLSVDELIQSLIHPAVPGLTNARALASALCTYSPLPRHTILMPVLAALCASDAPAPLQAAGFDILSAYWENGEAKSLELADRMSYFSLFTGQAATTWTTELWEPKFKALRAITKFGVEILGIEVQFFSVIKSWIMNAFEHLFVLDPNERAERAERERSIEILSAFLNSVIDKPEVMARITEEEFVGVLEFYGSMVDRCIDVPSRPTSPASAPETRPSFTHHRQQSSISITSLPSPTFSGPPLLIPQPAVKQPVDIAVSLYITHLTKQLNQLPPTTLDVILPLLFRALAICASPLARLTVTSTRNTGKRSFVEDRINEMLNSLFAGPYASTCLRVLQRNLYPSPKINDNTFPKEVQMAIQTSFGALRSLREYIRRTLSTRLARAYISKESAIGYSHSGAPTHLDLSRDMLERAWPKVETSTTSFSSTNGNGWDAARFRKPLSRSTRAWVEFKYTNQSTLESARDTNAVRNGETENVNDTWVKEGKERILEEIAGILKDVIHEIESRDEDNIRLDEEEALTVGETLFQLSGLITIYRNADGTPYLMPLSQPSSAASPFIWSLCFLLALDHTMTLNPPLSTTLLHISSHLFDSDTAKLPQIMREELSPTTPEWLENWKALLESPLAMDSRKALTRKAVMKVLECTYGDVKDLRG